MCIRDSDPGETDNLFFKNESKRKELQELLEKLKKEGRSAPEVRKPIGFENIKPLSAAKR